MGTEASKRSGSLVGGTNPGNVLFIARAIPKVRGEDGQVLMDLEPTDQTKAVEARHLARRKMPIEKSIQHDRKSCDIQKM